MKTFLEFSTSFDEISKSFASAKDYLSIENMQYIKDFPIDKLKNLPFSIKSNAAEAINNFQKENWSYWKDLKEQAFTLWNQPIQKPGKTLGMEMLNLLSAKVFKEMESEFFISYSGPLAKSAIVHYTGVNTRVISQRFNHVIESLTGLLTSVYSDYATVFNNSLNRVVR